MPFVKLVVLPVPDGLRPQIDYEARIFVASDEPLRHDLAVEGRLGGQDVDGLEVQPHGESLSGFVRRMPQAGDELELGLGGDTIAATGLTVQAADLVV